MYKSLSPGKIIETVSLLQQRIDERFPDSNLGRVCAELSKIAHASKKRSDWIRKPIMGLRVGVGILITFSVVLIVYSISVAEINWGDINGGDLIEAVEASIQTLFFIGVMSFFLITAEVRIKRERALEAVHELRVIAHVIDMHQLTKDPGRIINKGWNTASSPGNDMTVFELIRYLDYCTELLSLTGKIAALYAQNFRDLTVLSSVNEVEHLTTELSQKIWQKIMILHKLDESRDVLSSL